MTLYISPEGDFLISGTTEFFDRIGYRNPDFDAGDYCVRNLGFVSVRREDASIKIRFRPELTSGKAVDGTFRYLSRQPTEKVLLEFFDGDWVEEAWPNDMAVLHRLVVLCSNTSSNETATRFQMKPLPVKNAAEDFSNPLKPLFQKWRVSLSQFDDTTLPFLMKFGYGSKLIIVGASSSGEALRFQFIGDGFKFYDKQTMADVIGRAINDQPDAQYGSWVAEQYNAVVQSNQPRLDLVDATIRTPTGEARHSKYERLLLPWRSETGGVVVTCASVLLWQESEGGPQESGPAPEDRRRRSSRLGPLRHKPLDISHQFQAIHSNERQLKVAPRGAR